MHLSSLAILAVLASALLIATPTFAGDGVVTLANLTPHQTGRVHPNAIPLPRLAEACKLKCGIYSGAAECPAHQCECSCARQPICGCRYER
jgi:hypothetical protein